LSPQGQGYLLARKDLCLLSHVPALVQNEIAALKIEGRMRSAEFLAPVVTLYRKAVDAYFEDPAAYATNAADMQKIFAQRVREMTTAHSFSNPGSGGVEISGRREPRFFSHAAPAPGLTIGHNGTAKPVGTAPELIVHVASIAGAQAAVEAGAEAVYFCHEGLGKQHLTGRPPQGRRFDLTLRGGPGVRTTGCPPSGVLMCLIICDERRHGRVAAKTARGWVRLAPDHRGVEASAACKWPGTSDTAVAGGLSPERDQLASPAD
jgi:hypothetical protein